MKKKSNWILLIIPFIAMVVSLLVYSRLPDTIPVHFDVRGQGDDFAPKIMALITPVFILGLGIFLAALPKLDPRGKNYEKFSKTYSVINLCVLLFMLFIHCWSLAIALEFKFVSTEYFMPVITGILLIAIGNLLPKIRQNYMVGVKTIWAFNDSDNWNKTNRLGGRCLVVAGFLLFFAGFIPLPYRLSYVLGTILMSAFLPIFYSYWIFYKKTRGK